ncbi:glutamate receptor ionotropic, delta-2-like [Eriocheir sinensis]|uniref:glutamate receptor ionotropic, delta-2-like n=1 Tax=Eriocheir sinensis TaxID=95602 RepID=UPI0021C84DD7|nr:glutamate receptor ionotropic, delta-2-like [Eriocheir sinensis]
MLRPRVSVVFPVAAAVLLLPALSRGHGTQDVSLRPLLPSHALGANDSSALPPHVSSRLGSRRGGEIELLLPPGSSAEGREREATRRQRAKTKKLLRGHVMSIVLKHRLPYVSLKLDGRRVLGSSGILIELLHSLTRMYNFTYTLKLPDDGQWGSVSSDGRWNGMVGEVHRYEVEMALGPTSITEEREKAIDFTTPFDFEPWDIMIPAAGENVDLATFLMPFEGLVWAAVVASWVIVGCLAVLLLHPLAGVAGAALYPHTRTHAARAPRQASLLRTLLDSLGSLTAQSVSRPQTEATRVLAAWWWVFSVITIASYSSKLISSITVRFSSPAITSMLQMVETRPMLWTYQANSAMEELFKYSEPDSMFGKVGGLHRETSDLLVYSFEGGVQAVLKDKLAYVEDASLLEMAIASDLAIHGSCRMSLVNDHFFSTRFGMILQRGSPYRDAFSLDILQFIDTGLMDAWKKRFWPVASRCISSTKKRPVRSLNLLDTSGTLLLFLGGVSLSCCVLLLEILLGQWRGSKFAQGG